MEFQQRALNLLCCVLALLWTAHIDCFDVVVDDVDDDDANQPAHIYNHDHTGHVENSEAVGDVGSSRNNRALQTVTVGQIVDLILVNADTNQPIRRLVNGTIINLGTTGTTNFSVQATVTTTGAVGSVRFGYNATTNYTTQDTAPYSLCGGSGTDYRRCPMLSKVGIHTITATSYSGKKATGVIGSKKKVSFRISNLNPVPPAQSPVPPPKAIKAPTKSPSVRSKAPTKAPTKNPNVRSKAPTKAPTKSPIIRSKAPTKVPTPSPFPVKTCSIPKFTSTWENFLPSYPLIVHEVQADLIQNDIVITGGFTNSFRNVTNHTYARSIVNIGNSTWIRMDDMPVRVGITHAPTVVVGTRMYMCGGYVGRPPGPHTSDCFTYDHSIPPGRGQQWQSFPSLPNGGTGGGGIVYNSDSNTLYYTGGAQRPYLGNLTAIDRTDTWKISLDNINAGWVSGSDPIPYGANHQGYVSVSYLQQEERHFILGGQKGENEATGNVNDVYEFDANSETWSRKANLPFPRGHTAVSSRAIGNCGFITAGGAINSIPPSAQLKRTADIHYYHIPTNAWYFMGTLPQSMVTPPVFVGSDNYVYFVGRTMLHRISFTT